MDVKLYNEAYGIRYADSVTAMSLREEEINKQRFKGFSSYKECATWAHNNLLDILVLGKAQHQFYYVSHHGEVLTKAAWCQYYCSDILYIVDRDGVQHAWVPNGYEYYDRARVHGEMREGHRLPLYHRDYFTPTGFFDMNKQTFNVAKPFEVYAKETGRDTSHVYTLIEHVAGECHMWLLAWLRAKCLYPTRKTEVVPIIVSRTQGNGKTTFAEVICKGLFGKDNVLVTDQYDGGSRFNADYADALVVCHEEREYEDRRNSSSILKSRSTATTIRKEHKGLDPIYQDSFTEFIVTTNNDVPIKFEDREDQRRFMVMEADPDFTRKKSKLADEVFSKLYGFDANGNIAGIPFKEDTALIEQFKHELVSRADIEAIELRKFPRTAAAERCFTMPRTAEATEIESIMRSIAPFIAASLEARQVITEVDNMQLHNFIPTNHALQWFNDYVAICRPVVFVDADTHKPMAHATVERGIFSCAPWLLAEYNIRILDDMSPLPGGFVGINNRHRLGPAARFVKALVPKYNYTEYADTSTTVAERIGHRLRVNGRWAVDEAGEFETVNEMKPGTSSLKDKNNNVQYMDTFLFEADGTDKITYAIEMGRLEKGITTAERVFAERLRMQLNEAERLYFNGKAARIVYSGGKSYHMLVRIKDAPSTLESYKWLHAHLCTVLSDKVAYDPSTADPARLTRAPITFERTFEYNGYVLYGTQKLEQIDWHNVYDYDWRALYKQWVDRPLDKYEYGRKLYPSKPEYIEAMRALLDGTFWTHKIFNGNRQRLFFPAYRLCRMAGYTHEQLWSEDGILDGLNFYYIARDRYYWRTRESCKLIRTIDEEVDSDA